MVTQTQQITNELQKIGSTYHGVAGWRHKDRVAGRRLVGELTIANRKLQAIREETNPPRPEAWGPRGELGSIICIRCGKRGQELGTTCDHCGSAL
uniref:Uncharacterized protein n=1 Tax=viral metagenome TaxID=1070528 RepID=A0A6H1ZPS1_9ZZZZ